MMKATFIGNRRNFSFTLARYLRDRGFDARIVVLGHEGALHHPANDSFKLDYMSFVSTAPWGDPMLFSACKPRQVREALGHGSVLIGSDSAPAFVDLANMELFALLAERQDLIEYTHFHIRVPRRRAAASMLKFPVHQRRGIARARLALGPRMPDSMEPLRAAHFTGTAPRIFLPDVYAPDFRHDGLMEARRRNNWFAEFSRIRSGTDLMLVHPCRLNWRSENPFKQTPVLLQGLATFAKSQPRTRVRLLLPDYGPDANATRELVRALGLDAHVQWMPLMARKDLLLGMMLCDLVVCELGQTPSYSETLSEAIALGRPTLHGNPTSPSFPWHRSHHASTPQAVAEQLVDCMDARARTLDDAHASRLSWNAAAEAGLDAIGGSLLSAA